MVLSFLNIVLLVGSHFSLTSFDGVEVQDTSPLAGPPPPPPPGGYYGPHASLHR